MANRTINMRDATKCYDQMHLHTLQSALPNVTIKCTFTHSNRHYQMLRSNAPSHTQLSLLFLLCVMAFVPTPQSSARLCFRHRLPCIYYNTLNSSFLAFLSVLWPLFQRHSRLPVSFSVAADGSATTTKSAGGLVSGLSSVKALSMTWVGWPGQVGLPFLFPLPLPLKTCGYFFSLFTLPIR
jgi:hypothetical protein